MKKLNLIINGKIIGSVSPLNAKQIENLNKKQEINADEVTIIKYKDRAENTVIYKGIEYSEGYFTEFFNYK